MPDATRLFHCPNCDVLIEADETEPPAIFDADDLLKMHCLRFQFENFGKAMRRLQLALLFCRFGCWLAGIDLEWREAGANLLSSPDSLPEPLPGQAVRGGDDPRPLPKPTGLQPARSGANDEGEKPQRE